MRVLQLLLGTCVVCGWVRAGSAGAGEPELPSLHHLRHQLHHNGDPRGYQQAHRAPTPGPEQQKEFRDLFHNLQTQLADQFNVLKTMILNLEDKIGAMDIGMARSERRLLSSITRSRSCGSDDQDSTRDPPLPALDDYDDGPAEEADDALNADYYEQSRDVTRADEPGVREEEVRRLNNTVHADAGGCGRVFTYFWRVRNMHYKLTGWHHRRSLRSPSFYVYPGGYRMYLRIYPRHSAENVFVHVGLTRGENDASLRWPFHLKLRLTVLDQVEQPQDLVSRLWDPSQLCSGYNWQRPAPAPTLSQDNYECVGLGFPQSVLRSRSYIRQNAILLKLTVCLDT